VGTDTLKEGFVLDSTAGPPLRTSISPRTPVGTVGCSAPEDRDDDSIPRCTVLNRGTEAVFGAVLKRDRGESAFGSGQFLRATIRQRHTHRDDGCVRLGSRLCGRHQCGDERESDRQTPPRHRSLRLLMLEATDNSQPP
jgi:hypothetical protein